MELECGTELLGMKEIEVLGRRAAVRLARRGVAKIETGVHEAKIETGALGPRASAR